MESAPNAMVIVDRDGRIVLMNSETERLFGYRLRTVRRTLSGNAIRFTDRGRVSLIAEQCGAAGARCTTLKVQNTGVGIPEEERETLFMPFEQLGRTRRREDSGLGQHPSQTLAELLGTRIAATSEAGGGSCFTLFFDET